MKRLVFFIIVTLFLSTGLSVYGQPITEIINEQMDTLNLLELEGMIKDITRDISEFIPQVTLREAILSMLGGNFRLSISDISKGVLLFLFHEVTGNYKLLGTLLVLTIICGIFKNFQSAFEGNSTGKLAVTICHITLIGIAVNSFHIAFRIGSIAIQNMVTFMQALLPILLTLMVAMGGIVSGGVFQPIILMAVTGVSTLIKNIVLPLVFFSAILAIINNIAENIQVSRLSSLLKDISVAALGIFMSVLLGILIVQGATASAIDGISIRTAKFATKTFVPIIGGIFADTLDTIVGCSLLLKNSLTSIGLIVIFLICIFPIIKIISLVFIYRVVGALMEPISEDRLIKCINSIGNSLVFLFVIVAAVGVMFFITLTIIVGASNITLMMR